jgi:hypothetical protein
MASFIRDLLQGGTCSKVLAVFGSNHVGQTCESQVPRDIGKNSVRGHLKQFGVPAKAINIAPAYGIWRDSFAWPCGQNPTLPAAIKGYVNLDSPVQIPMDPISWNRGLYWNDFDGTIVLPNDAKP